MSYVHLRATASALSGEDKDDVRHTIGAILLFLPALASAAFVSASFGSEAAAPDRTDRLPTSVAGS